MGDAVELDGVRQRLHDVRLPDHLAEVLRSMGAVERGHRGIVEGAAIAPGGRQTAAPG